MATTDLYAVHPVKNGESIEMDNSAYQRTSSYLTGIRRVQKRFEKTRSRMVYHAILGLGDLPQQASRWQLLAIGTLLADYQE